MLFKIHPMTVPLLTTKLHIPRIHPGLVSRSRLVDRLERSLKDGKLTLISAPAGFGKTTLVNEWIAKSSTPFAWLSLDRSDNDLRRFLAYVVAALKTISIDVHEDLSILHPTQQPMQIESGLIPLINQITESEVHFVLVLDDYHLIESREIHEALTFIIDHQPPKMHLLLLNRADPPLPLPRLRARGDMAEIREEDLRFSLDESIQFLNQVQRLELSREEIQALNERTEGWAAGLRLASITLQGREDTSKYIQRFTGSYEYIADYLTDEVILQQPAHFREFLLETSILDRFCSSLCDAVTGAADSDQYLDQLRDANLFLVPLDDVGVWFRYHQLFMDLLQGRLLGSRPEIVPGLYLKTSEWFEQNGYLEEAIDYALRGSAFDRAASLIVGYAEVILMRSEITTFVRWVEKLPEEFVRKQGLLCIYYAWALLVRGGEYQKARYHLEQIRPEDEQVEGQLKAVKSILFVYQRKTNEAIALARQALDQLPENDHFFRQIAAWNLSALLFIRGDQEGGAKMLEEVARISLAHNNYLVAIIALCRLGSYHMLSGKLSLAAALFEQALSIRPDDQNHRLPAASEAMLGLGKVAWERYDLEKANEHLKEGIEMGKRWREVMDIDSYVTLAHIRQSTGDVSGAKQMIARAKKLANQTSTTDADDRFVDSQGALLYLRQGNIQAVNRWIAARGLESYLDDWVVDNDQGPGAAVILHYELLVFARYLMTQERYREALGLLSKLRSPVERLGHLAKILEIGILTAIALKAIGETQRAISAIKGVLSAAEPERFKRVFVDEAPLLSGLIDETISYGFESRFAKDILSALSEGREKYEPLEKAETLIEPLSDRELQVLRILESEMGVPEMAGHLHIAVSTLRTHIRNIYYKLGVHSRFEAVSKAKDLNLI